ncbi:MAG: SDR family oxidoreductase [Desulfobacteraceae bacterium]|nr:SDR family oxidoreductase [Desulfobacteraceae bacterium]MBC2756243.1 SDR family oxidoreductase [Desulfobacteraceae bacterium]
MTKKKENKINKVANEFTGIPLDDDFPGKTKINNLFDVTDKTAIVTGAAHGLGRQIALGLASFGADVVVADINVDGAEETAKSIEEIGRSALVANVNVTNPTEINEMVNKTLEKFGKIDICFNIPGINIRKPTLDLTLDEFNMIIDTNLKGLFYCAQAVGKVMVEQKRGKIINMSSIMGIIGNHNQCAYAASKAGIIQFTKVMALEWAEENVQVNTIAPGYHMTVGPLAKQYIETPEGKAMIEGIMAKIPQNRMAHSSEIIGPALFLASDASNYVTGSVIVPDGGWTAQ